MIPIQKFTKIIIVVVTAAQKNKVFTTASVSSEIKKNAKYKIQNAKYCARHQSSVGIMQKKNVQNTKTNAKVGKLFQARNFMYTTAVASDRGRGTIVKTE